ncbi:hypothetical protein ASF61_17185 [Duganella sp. Leaf126]|uniref:hypothetical protein n=1 Tax=Duganella sp. Leaf126 TaxID=1736266 RepID=UPI0006FB9912|nr:hypothetical protein [Duganella sp. Leaf126]KQQ30968.1 hypothetical protein ASF61_17185 [Duganella sp. Leaf126]
MTPEALCQPAKFQPDERINRAAYGEEIVIVNPGLGLPALAAAPAPRQSDALSGNIWMARPVAQSLPPPLHP